MMRDANLKTMEVDNQIISNRSKMSAKIQEERLFHSRESATLRRKLVNTIDKQLHKETIDKITMNVLSAIWNSNLTLIYNLIQINALNNKCVAWQNKLNELDLSCKDKLSKEQQRRRNAVQQQLDKASVAQDQLDRLREIIEGLECMNFELADEVKSAKKEARAATKLYDKSKVARTKLSEKLMFETVKRNELTEELTRLLKAQESQLEVLQEYERMIEGYQSSKLNFNCERNCESKVRQRGGKRWPLWVTQVCCELLIHGSPPSAVPSNIGSLMATLYGEEPKSCHR